MEPNIWSMLVCFRWLGINLEILANVVVLGSAIFAVVTPGISGGDIGLSVSYAMQVRNFDVQIMYITQGTYSQYSHLITNYEMRFMNILIFCFCIWPENGSGGIVPRFTSKLLYLHLSGWCIHLQQGLFLSCKTSLSHFLCAYDWSFDNIILAIQQK